MKLNLTVKIAFRCSLKCPLIVHFVGEEGIDLSGLRMEFLSMLVGYYELALPAARNAGYVEQEVLGMEFAAGVFFGTVLFGHFPSLHELNFFSIGLAMVQCDIFRPLMYQWYKKARAEQQEDDTTEHPYLKGLNLLGIADVSQV